MKYDKQNLRELLAGEYVLGLLRGGARRRFERLLLEDAGLRRELVGWERHLAAWNLALEPVMPPARVWRELDKHVRSGRRQETFNLWEHLGFWRGLAVAATLVLAVVIVGRSLAPTAPTTPAYLAVMSSAKGEPLWLITAHPRSRRIDMKALTDTIPPPGKSYELWMLPGSGTPVPMGLMNSGGIASETVSPEVMAALASAKGLAISVEPYGGSPTGQPTGPVVYTAAIIQS